MREKFAAYDAVITDQDPAARPHIEAVLGESPSHVGYAQNIWGVAP